LDDIDAVVREVEAVAWQARMARPTVNNVPGRYS